MNAIAIALDERRVRDRAQVQDDIAHHGGEQFEVIEELGKDRTQAILPRSAKYVASQSQIERLNPADTVHKSDQGRGSTCEVRRSRSSIRSDRIIVDGAVSIERTDR